MSLGERSRWLSLMENALSQKRSFVVGEKFTYTDWRCSLHSLTVLSVQARSEECLESVLLRLPHNLRRLRWLDVRQERSRP